MQLGVMLGVALRRPPGCSMKAVNAIRQDAWVY
jgi:hypothetical protein